MAIQLGSPNFAGLAGMASGGSNVPLASPGALGLQALQQMQAQQASLRDNSLGRAQLAQQGALGLAQQSYQQQALQQQQLAAQMQADQFKQSQQADAAKMAALARQQDRAFGAEDRQMSFAEKQLEQKIAAEKQAREMAKLLDMKKEDLQARGSMAAYGLMAMKGAKTPEEFQSIRMELYSGTNNFVRIRKMHCMANLHCCTFCGRD
jgi:hypothetical protein